MAQTTQTHQPASPGKPANPANTTKDPRQKAVGNLQYSLDRACMFIHDGQNSYAKRARAAARQEIPKEKVLKGLDAIQAAIVDARAAIERAYQPQPAKVEAKSRLTL